MKYSERALEIARDMERKRDEARERRLDGGLYTDAAAILRAQAEALDWCLSGRFGNYGDIYETRDSLLATAAILRENWRPSRTIRRPRNHDPLPKV